MKNYKLFCVIIIMELVKNGDKVIYNITICNGYRDNMEYNFRSVVDYDGEIMGKNKAILNFKVKMGLNFNFNICVMDEKINFRVINSNKECFIGLDKTRENVIIEGYKTDNIKITINPRF